MNKIIPKYLVELNNIILYLIFVMFFSILFVNIFSPFNGQWYSERNGIPVTKYQNFLYSVIIVAGGIVIMSLSRTFMRFIHKRHPLSYIEFGSWIIIEMFAIAMAYTIICAYGLNDARPFADIFGRAIVYIPLILLIPDAIAVLYLGLKDRDAVISDLSEKSTVLPAAATETSKTDRSAPQTDPPMNIINFMDEKGVLRLSVKADNVYYLESSDNYIDIYYLDKETIGRFVLRSSLKKQEDRLRKFGFIRCHRSYMVNFSKIVLMRKEKDGPYLNLGHKELKEIPVSKTYLDHITGLFTVE